MNDVKVKQLMTRLVVTLAPMETIHEAAAKLAANGISGAPVVENGEVIGMVSESDILYAAAPSTPRRRRSVLEMFVNIRNLRPVHPPGGPIVRDIMSSLVIFQVSPESSIWEAASLIESRGVKRLPVIDEKGKLVGIISRGDLIRAMGRDDAAIRADVVETVEILGPESFNGLEITVEQGVAMIRGTADRKSTKNIAVRLARRVPGVVKVTDELQFETDDSRTRVNLHPADLEPVNPLASTRKGGFR